MYQNAGIAPSYRGHKIACFFGGRPRRLGGI